MGAKEEWGVGKDWWTLGGVDLDGVSVDEANCALDGSRQDDMNGVQVLKRPSEESTAAPIFFVAWEALLSCSSNNLKISDAYCYQTNC